MRTVKWQEWIWVVVISAMIVAAAALPYQAGYLTQTPDWRFSGSIVDKVDYHSHLAKMWQGYRGGWRYSLLFTSEPHRGVYVQTFCVARGHLARITQIPIHVYDLWVFRSQPVFAAWAAQNVTLSPPLSAYLWGYGRLLVQGIVGLAVWAQRSWPGLAFPLIWIVLVTVLTYIPWYLQRRFLEGVQVPLGLLAGVGMAEGLFPKPTGHGLSRPRWLAMALLVALAALSNLYLTIGHTVAAVSRDSRLFWPAEVLAGADWPGEYTEPDDTVLSSFRIGNLIPARIGHRLVLGHWMETIDCEEKARAVARFFASDASDEERVALLEEHDVAYLFYRPHEWGPLVQRAVGT